MSKPKVTIVHYSCVEAVYVGDELFTFGERVTPFGIFARLGHPVEDLNVDWQGLPDIPVVGSSRQVPNLPESLAVLTDHLRGLEVERRRAKIARMREELGRLEVEEWVNG